MQVPSELPRGGLPTLAELLQGNAPSIATGIVTVGGVIWLVTYILAIRTGFKHKTYAIPFLAVCLNFTWEFAHSVVFRPDRTSDLVIHFAWLAIDAVILYQVFKFGRKYEKLPFIRKHFAAFVVGMLILLTAAHVSLQWLWNYNAIFPDQDGAIVAFIINLVMSILFVEMLYKRPKAEGMTLGVAWTKMLGSACYSVGNAIALGSIGHVLFEVQYRPAGGSEWIAAGDIGSTSIQPGFIYLLFVVTFAFDVLYIVLLHRRLKKLRLQEAAG